MRHYRTAILVLLVAFSSLVPGPAAGAPPARAPEKSASGEAPAGPSVNINTASVKELMKLEGVGRQVAQKIVEYRDAHGPFKKPEELRKVEGVGSGLWERNRARIVIK
jgi:competence protein ComEA